VPGYSGGAGVASSITGSPVYRAGGGSGAYSPSPSSPGPLGQTANGQNAADNSGGGGGGGAQGGSGVVILKSPADSDITVTPGTNSVTTLPSGEKVATFTVTGTYKANKFA
jgi:hypothetical protein